MRNIVGVLLVGWFAALFGCSKSDSGMPGRFVSESAFQQNLAKQTKMSPQTVAQLRKYGVTEDATLKLEFFFYTDTEEKASTLTKELRSRVQGGIATLRVGRQSDDRDRLDDSHPR